MVKTRKYFIGEYYRYPNGKQFFKLASFDPYGWFEFECGHRVADSVFDDLIRVKTGVQVFEDLQTEILF